MLLDTTELPMSTLFEIVILQHQNKTKATNFMIHGRAISLLYTWSHHMRLIVAKYLLTRFLVSSKKRLFYIPCVICEINKHLLP